MTADSGDGKAPRRRAKDGSRADLATALESATKAHWRARAREAAIAEICEHLRAGRQREHACDLVGVPRRTFYNWLADEEIATMVRQALAIGALGQFIKVEDDLDAIPGKGGKDRVRAANVRMQYIRDVYPDYMPKQTTRVESTTVVLTPDERRQKYAALRLDGVIVAGADPELEAECVAAGLLPADVVDGEVEEGE